MLWLEIAAYVTILTGIIVAIALWYGAQTQ